MKPAGKIACSEPFSGTNVKNERLHATLHERASCVVRHVHDDERASPPVGQFYFCAPCRERVSISPLQFQITISGRFLGSSQSQRLRTSPRRFFVSSKVGLAALHLCIRPPCSDTPFHFARGPAFGRISPQKP